MVCEWVGKKECVCFQAFHCLGRYCFFSLTLIFFFVFFFHLQPGGDEWMDACGIERVRETQRERERESVPAA